MLCGTLLCLSLFVMSKLAAWQASTVPVIVTTLFSVLGRYSPRWEILMRAPELDWSSSIVEPPRPRMQPTMELGTAICTTWWWLGEEPSGEDAKG